MKHIIFVFAIISLGIFCQANLATRFQQLHTSKYSQEQILEKVIQSLDDIDSMEQKGFVITKIFDQQQFSNGSVNFQVKFENNQTGQIETFDVTFDPNTNQINNTQVLDKGNSFETIDAVDSQDETTSKHYSIDKNYNYSNGQGQLAADVKNTTSKNGKLNIQGKNTFYIDNKEIESKFNDENIYDQYLKKTDGNIDNKVTFTQTNGDGYLNGKWEGTQNREANKTNFELDTSFEQHFDQNEIEDKMKTDSNLYFTKYQNNRTAFKVDSKSSINLKKDGVWYNDINIQQNIKRYRDSLQNATLLDYNQTVEYQDRIRTKNIIIEKSKDIDSIYTENGKQRNYSKEKFLKKGNFKEFQYNNNANSNTVKIGKYTDGQTSNKNGPKLSGEKFIQLGKFGNNVQANIHKEGEYQGSSEGNFYQTQRDITYFTPKDKGYVQNYDSYYVSEGQNYKKGGKQKTLEQNKSSYDYDGFSNQEIDIYQNLTIWNKYIITHEEKSKNSTTVQSDSLYQNNREGQKEQSYDYQHGKDIKQNQKTMVWDTKIQKGDSTTNFELNQRIDTNHLNSDDKKNQKNTTENQIKHFEYQRNNSQWETDLEITEDIYQNGVKKNQQFSKSDFETRELRANGSDASEQDVEQIQILIDRMYQQALQNPEYKSKLVTTEKYQVNGTTFMQNTQSTIEIARQAVEETQNISEYGYTFKFIRDSKVQTINAIGQKVNLLMVYENGQTSDIQNFNVQLIIDNASGKGKVISISNTQSNIIDQNEST